MDRRAFIGRSAATLALSGLAPSRVLAQTLFDPVPPLVPIRALPDRIFRTTVCLRPFRKAGPRMDTEHVGRKIVIHNYGHGGSGWSLSWGSARQAVKLAIEAGAKDLAVIGCGAIGITTAIMAQRAGLGVTIYAKEQFPEVRSARATGTWSPDSRVAMADSVDAGFADRWEVMARDSFAFYQSFLGMPGAPVEWTDRYNLSDKPIEQLRARAEEPDTTGFLHLESRLRDITPRSQILPPGAHPFALPTVTRNSSLTFNVADLARQLVSDFLLAGGKIIPMEFHQPGDVTKLKQRVVVNCTGYGARALWRDETIIPVRGQIAWLIPQEGLNYGINYKSLGILGRRDGIVVQELGDNELFGFGDDNEVPDRAAAEASVRLLAEIYRPAFATQQ
jgi:glycine/D-amino acid oxidase-like deaminating enzyme